MSENKARISKKEKSIILYPHEVGAILDGQQAQLRRVIKPQPPKDALEVFVWNAPKRLRDLASIDALCAERGCYFRTESGLSFHKKCSYGEIGDLLWVKETFNCNDYRFPNDAPAKQLKEELMYRADHNTICNCFEEKMVWRPSIHMPRWASRITLEITNIRVERLQDISEADAQAEGVEIADDITGCADDLKDSYRIAFSYLWDKINAKRGFSWESNPFVWVIEFKRLEAK